jgi:hypothetical protein
VQCIAFLKGWEGWAWWNGIKEAKIFQEKIQLFKKPSRAERWKTIQKGNTVRYGKISKHFQYSWKSFQLFLYAEALVFPGTSTVQSDFSFIGWEKDNYRFNLTDLFIEGIPHAKQSGTVAQVEEYLDIMATKKPFYFQNQP